MRRLGTLTLEGKAPSSDDPWRARDVTWVEVHSLLERRLDDFSPDVRLVARDFRDHLAGCVLPPVVPAGFLRWGGELAHAASHSEVAAG